MAIGSAARETALYTICAHTFPGRVAFAVVSVTCITRAVGVGVECV